MGKKKPKGANFNDPESLKEAGNKAFLGNNFDEALNFYTKAIDLTQEKPNHIYFCNRANVYLEKK